MASLIRSAKSGSDWSRHELLAYNITGQYQDVIDFFGDELGSIDHLDSNLLPSADPTIAANFSKETYRFLVYLDLASRGNGAIDELANSALQVTCFEQIGTILRMRHDIPFFICRDTPLAARRTCVLFTSTP
jgi:hypothetical protein